MTHTGLTADAGPGSSDVRTTADVSGLRRRKILHVTSACTVGGCEAHVLALLSRLDPTRYDLWLAYFEERPDDARPMVADFRNLGVQTVDLRGRSQIDPMAVLKVLGKALLRPWTRTPTPEVILMK